MNSKTVSFCLHGETKDPFSAPILKSLLRTYGVKLELRKGTFPAPCGRSRSGKTLRHCSYNSLTDPFTTFELQNPPLVVTELHKICPPQNFEVLKLSKGRSGAISEPAFELGSKVVRLWELIDLRQS